MEEIDLTEIFYLFWKKKAIIAVVLILSAFLGIIYSYAFVTPKYQSYTTLILAQNQIATANTGTITGITQTDITLNQKLISTYSDLIKSKSVIREVMDNLDIDRTEEQVRDSVSVSYKNDNEIIQITVVDEDPAVAANIANELASVFKRKVAEEIFKLDNVHIIDQAEQDNEPYNIHHIRDILIAVIIGAVLSVLGILVMNMFNTSIKDSKEIEVLLKVKVLAEIPMIGGDLNAK